LHGATQDLGVQAIVALVRARRLDRKNHSEGYCLCFALWIWATMRPNYGVSNMSETSSGGSAPAPKAVQSPLTLVMKIKSDAAYQELKALLNQMQSAPPDRNPIWVALNKLRNVHFARFVFLNNNTQLAVITTYDGTFDA